MPLACYFDLINKAFFTGSDILNFTLTIHRAVTKLGKHPLQHLENYMLEFLFSIHMVQWSNCLFFCCLTWRTLMQDFAGFPSCRWRHKVKGTCFRNFWEHQFSETPANRLFCKVLPISCWFCNGNEFHSLPVKFSKKV